MVVVLVVVLVVVVVGVCVCGGRGYMEGGGGSVSDEKLGSATVEAGFA